MEHTGFPSDETLAAFLDGRLDADTRRKVVEHMTECDECYSVVAGGAPNGLHEMSSRPAPSAAVRAGWWRIAAGAIAAAVAGIALLNGPRLFRSSPAASKTGSQLLADVDLPTRHIEGRLAGFGYAPFEKSSVSRGNGSDNGLNLSLSALSAALESQAASDPTVENRRAAGLSMLMLGKSEQAVTDLENALRLETGESEIGPSIAKSKTPLLLSDLAAAYCARASGSDNPADILIANDAASRAYALDPRSPEVAWNRAVAISKLGIPERTDSAWLVYQKLDDTSQWSLEARARRMAAKRVSEVKEWERLVPLLEEQIKRGSLGALDSILATHVRSARTEIESAMQEWSAARMRGDVSLAASRLAFGKAVGCGLQRITGDPFWCRTLQGIQDLQDSPSASATFAAYFARSRDLGSQTAEAATGEIERLVPELEKLRSSLALAARTNLLLCRFYAERYAMVIDSAKVISSEAHRAGHYALEGRAQSFLGLSYGRVGRPYDAVVAYGNAIDAYERGQEPDSVLIAKGLLAEMEQSVGRAEQAWRGQFDVLNGHAGIAQAGWKNTMLATMASTAQKAGHRGAALELITAAVNGARRGRELQPLHDALLFRGELRAAVGDSAATADFTEAATLRRQMPRGLAARLDTLAAQVQARSLAPTNPAKGLALVDSALVQATNVSLGYALPSLRLARAEALLARDTDLHAVDAELRLGIAEVEKQRLGAQTGDRADDTGDRLYRRLISVLLRTGDTQDAFLYLDQYRRYRFSSAAPRTTADTQLELRGSRLAYLFVPNGLAVFLQSASGIAVTMVPASETRLKSLVEDAWERADERQSAALSELSKALIFPIEKQLAGTSLIAIMADGCLNAVPFAALTTSSGRMLVDLAPIVRSGPGGGPSLGDRESQESVLLIGNPDFDRTAFGYLPDLPRAESEAQQVAKLFPRAQVITGRKATRREFMTRAPRASIIQISAHGLPGGSEPLNSALLLAPDGQSDSGILYARDILGLRLGGVRLVVLSGCETGRATETFTGASLADAFIGAGAQYVLGTLCAVEDAEAESFVVSFQSKLAARRPVLAAFHETQQEFARCDRSGSVWRAFSLTSHG
jgi:CHAT domain-containing protein